MEYYNLNLKTHLEIVKETKMFFDYIHGMMPINNSKENIYKILLILRNNNCKDIDLMKDIKKISKFKRITSENLKHLLSLLDNNYHASITNEEFDIYGHIYYK